MNQCRYNFSIEEEKFDRSLESLHEVSSEWSESVLCRDVTSESPMTKPLQFHLNRIDAFCTSCLDDDIGIDFFFTRLGLNYEGCIVKTQDCYAGGILSFLSLGGVKCDPRHLAVLMSLNSRVFQSMVSILYLIRRFDVVMI